MFYNNSNTFFKVFLLLPKIRKMEGKLKMDEEILEENASTEPDATQDVNSETENVEQVATENAEAEVNTVTFSEEDVTKLIEAEREKWESDKKEQERLNKLSKEEREIEIQAQKDKTIEELQQKLLTKELKDKVVSDLSKNGLPVELAELVNYTSKGDVDKSLDRVKNIFNASVESEVNKRLRGKTPKGLQTGIGGNAISKQEFEKMSYKERTTLYNTNRELYNKLNA